MTGQSGKVESVGIHRVECSVEWPPGEAVAYLIEGESLLLVDAGMPGDEPEAEFREGLAAAGYEPADVDVLLVTHPHRDHTGQVPTVVAANPDVELCAPAGVRDRLARDPDALEAAVERHAREAGCTPEEIEYLTTHAVENLQRARRLLPPERVDRWLDPGAERIAGIDFEVVHTPGHQAEHYCYRTDVEGESVLFSGDMAMEPFRPVAIHAGRDVGIEDAVPAFQRALERLDAMDVDRVYPGHGAVHTAFEATVERDGESLDRLLDSVRDLLAEGHDTARAIADVRTGDRAMRYMLPEVISALRYLTERGEVAYEEREGVRRYELA